MLLVGGPYFERQDPRVLSLGIDTCLQSLGDTRRGLTLNGKGNGTFVPNIISPPSLPQSSIWTWYFLCQSPGGAEEPPWKLQNPVRSPEGPRLASGWMGRVVVQEWRRNRRASRPEDVSELEPLLGTLPRDHQKESAKEALFGSSPLSIFHLWRTRILVPLSIS